ncbi:hypothetical protein [Nevskia sp.]|uniref:hypothetical protein n=1 Tax=Nevskia sp. TaxID=1929292 RepID=UPI0025DE729B|nr:hypothetical protein [Nevskia sp.]
MFSPKLTRHLHPPSSGSPGACRDHRESQNSQQASRKIGQHDAICRQNSAKIREIADIATGFGPPEKRQNGRIGAEKA